MAGHRPLANCVINKCGNCEKYLFGLSGRWVLSFVLFQALTKLPDKGFDYLLFLFGINCLVARVLIEQRL